MPQRVYFSPLGSDDAKHISRLQRKLFAPELCEPEDDIRQILRNTEEHMLCNLSFGLFHGKKMVAYVFAYVESESLFFKREEEVVYLKEVGVLPGYQRHLKSVFEKLFSLCTAFVPMMSIEGHALEDILVKWRRHERFFGSLGLTLSAIDEPPQKGRPPYKLLRFDFSPGAAAIPETPKALPVSGWSHSADITVTVVKNPRQWLALKEDWAELLQKTPDHNVFQSFTYLWEWWKYFGFWNELRIVVIRRREEVIGIAPLMLEHFPIFGKIVRKLMFISAPMEMSRPKLIFGENSATCLPALLAWLERHRNTWDILDIDEQVQDQNSRSICDWFRQNRYLIAESSTICPYIDIAGTWEQFLASRSRRLRSNISRLRRKIASEGEVEIRRVDSWPQLEKALTLHCEIEELSWKSGKKLEISSDKSYWFFYRALAKAFGANNSFEIRALMCGGKPLASTFGIRQDNVFQSIKIAHDSAFNSLSPGTILESYELEDLFEAGIERYEFMGSFLANKLRWTSTVFETTNLHVYQRQPHLVLFFFIYFVFKRKVKAVLKRTGQFENADRLLKSLKSNPFPRY